MADGGVFLLVLVHPRGNADAASDCAHAQDQSKDGVRHDKGHDTAQRRGDAPRHAGKTLHDAAQSAAHAAGACKALHDLRERLYRRSGAIHSGSNAVCENALDRPQRLADATAEVALIDRGQRVRKPLRDHVTLILRYLAPDQIDKIQS